MFVHNRSSVGVTAAADENASIIISAAAARAHTKTPSQLKTPKRRAFGDISNRKPSTTATAIKKTPSVHITTKRKQKESSTRKIVPPSTSNRRHVSFALPTTKNAVNEKRTTTTTTTRTTLNVELSAGRTWSEQQDHHHYEDDDDDDDIADILAEQEAWETEVAAFCQEEQTRHLNIRKVQQQVREQEYQEKLEALWKQDDDGMNIMLYCCHIMLPCQSKSHSSVLFIHSMRIDLAVAGLFDNLVLESVPSFDDLSLGEDSLGPLEHDISF
jgi:hypothetical protein